ncbi:hypothetical protein L1987_80464 [Smallanthus sonchifolius]|uniref:Uncharacterized protein n=1 Tax=Smallanthus sonchifolius TaxID=185202 RepID=A0ACB8YMP2_9ASTR|nr:hypothetical protein L1987_80464 [Smallanthus sonchifolius]
MGWLHIGSNGNIPILNNFWILLSVDHGQRPDRNLIHIPTPAVSVSDKISLPLPKSPRSVCNAAHGREWRLRSKEL